MLNELRRFFVHRDHQVIVENSADLATTTIIDPDSLTDLEAKALLGRMIEAVDAKTVLKVLVRVIGNEKGTNDE